MTLTDLLKKTKNKIMAPVFGLAMAVAPLYGCGDCPKEVVYKDTLGGMYPGTFRVTEDPQDVVLPADEEGEINLWVTPCSPEEKYFHLGVFDWKDYERSDNGWIKKKWWDSSLKLTEYHVRGTLSDDGQLDLDASIDGTILPSGDKYYVNWEIACEKQTEYLPEESSTAPAVRLQDTINLEK